MRWAVNGERVDLAPGGIVRDSASDFWEDGGRRGPVASLEIADPRLFDQHARLARRAGAGRRRGRPMIRGDEGGTVRQPGHGWLEIADGRTREERRADMIEDHEDIDLLLGGLADTDLSPPVMKGAVRLWLTEHLPDARTFDRPGGLLVARGRKRRLLLLGERTCTVRVAYSADPESGEDLGVGEVLEVLEYADLRLFDRLPGLL